MQETILVIGGAGYIGSHTAWLLAKRGYKVVVLDNLSQATTFCYLWAEFVYGDYGDATLLSEIFKKYQISAVMHFAASTVVSESVQHPLLYYHNNVAKTVTLFDVMIKYNVLKCIFSSSCAVYGNPLYLPLTEDHPCAPISPYGTTKYMIEQIFKDCQQAYGLEYVALRYFNAAGALPHEGLGERHAPETHGIPLLLQAVHTGKPFYVYGSDYPTKDGSCIRDYIHVLDIADAHCKALLHLHKRLPSDVFNLGTGVGYSVKELLEAVKRVTKKEPLIIPAARRKGDPAVLLADPTKARALLQWKPVYSDLTTMIQSAWVFEYQVHAPIKSSVKEQSPLL